MPCSGRWVVAFSGGADSTALLHALASGGALGRDLLAVHVNHGLQAEAEHWARQCEAVAATLGVPFRLQRVRVAADRSGPEAGARSARYAVLAESMRSGDVLLTAHHQDDQAETLLLQLLRGAGPAGLSAMPGLAPFGPGWHGRPLLDRTRTELQTYLRGVGLDWIEDPSNFSVAPTRNYLRHRVMPAIKARWPAVDRTLARAARHQAETQELLTVLGRGDLTAAAGVEPGTLCVNALLNLGRTRLHNALRVWLADKSLPLPNAARLEQLRSRVLSAGKDAQPLLRWPGAEIRRYRDSLYAMPPLPPHDPAQVLPWEPAQSVIELAWLGRRVSATELRADLDELHRSGERVTIRFRRGGERCRVRSKGHTRALKTLLQEAGLPPWERDRIPLLYVGECLYEVVGYWLCDRES